MTETTTKQTEVVAKLEKRGFEWIREIAGAEPETVAVLLTKRQRHGSIHAEVEADGSVNGLSLDGFLNWLRNLK